MNQPLALGAFEALSDEEIVDRVRAGDPALSKVLMRRHNTRLYRAVRAILRSDRDVEDVMQDAYVSAFQHLDQFAGRSQFTITRIAVNEAIARKHAAGRTEEWDAMSEHRREMSWTPRERSDPETDVASGEMARLLERSIDTLPESYRTVVVLRDIEEMSTSEAASCLAISEDNVKVRLHRGRALLRKELYAKAGRSAKDAFPFHAVRCDRVVAGVFAKLAVMQG